MSRAKWTGTMNLTEPQAGSDLAQVRSRAVPQVMAATGLRPEDFHHLR
jgi:alkylation response protein AidB-like acyl-CoA dehydrogenase